LGAAIAVGFLLRPLERSDGSTGIDSRIAVRVVAGRTDGLTSFAHAVSRVGSTSVLIPVVALVTGLLAWRHRFVLAGLLIVSWGGSVGLYDATKPAVDRLRPPPGIRLESAAGASFPSSHATQSLATYAALAIVVAAVRGLPALRGGPPPVLLWSVWDGRGCMYLGMHWPTDVGAGWLIGGAWVTLMTLLSRSAQHLTGASATPEPNRKGASPAGRGRLAR
jgi:membrane-associated phospholipid phosphatase